MNQLTPLPAPSDVEAFVGQVITDLRVFQGDYVGATSTFTPTRAHGTFVLI